MKAIDLFSGIGGFALGFERAGIETACFCEVSEVCRHLLAHHWPEVTQYDDVNTLTAERLVADGTAADVLCGGFPCQDLSYAGKGAGLSGERSGLWFQIARLLRELRDIGRPVRFVVLENVSALLGRGLGTVLGDLAALGYDAEWDCIPASAIGAPHRRDRIWIVAYPRGEQHEGFGNAFRRALATELSRAVMADAPEFGEREPADEANAVAIGRQARLEPVRSGERQPDLGGPVVNTRGRRHLASEGEVSAGRHGAFDASWWSTEPDVGRVAHGIPRRVDRLHGLGNAVVPAIPEIIGRAILTASNSKPSFS